MKKHGFRSIFSLLLALMMVCSMLPTAAFAEGDTEEQSVVVETYTVTYADGMGGAAFPEQKTDGLRYGDPTPAFAGAPALDGYTFTGWDQEIAGTVTQSVTYTALWQEVQQEAQSDVQPEADGNVATVREQVGKEILLLASNSSVPLTLRISSYGAPFKNGSTGEHNVNTYTWLKYIRRSDVGSDNARGSAHAYFKGSNESGWQLWLKVEVGNYKYEAAQNAWVYNKDMSAATGNITYGLSFNTSGGTSTTIRISGAKDLPKPTTYTYVLNYDANGGTGAPSADSWSTTDASIRYHSFTVTSTVPTRAGYTFKGWKGTANDGSDTIYTGGMTCAVSQYGNDVVKNDNTWTRTLYAVWEENRPSATWNEISKVLGTQVYVQCVSDTENHAKQGYELRYESSAVGRVRGGYACNVYVYANGKPGLTSYVEEYNTTYPNTNHVLDSDSDTGRRGFELRYNDGGDGWYIYKGDSVPIVFNVKCEEQQPEEPSEITDRDLEALLKGALKIECTVVGEHGKSYDVKKEDVRSKNVSGYNCEITFDATPYFGEFIGEFGQHSSAAGESYTKVITLKWVDGKWVATNTPIIHKVVCVPEIVPPAAPNEETVMGALKGAVQITCITPNSGHDLKVYDLMSGFTPGTVQGDASTGYTYTISVNAASYVYRYSGAAPDGIGAAHELATDEQQNKQITLHWNGTAWVAPGDGLPINFNVKCETENPPVDIKKPTFDELKDLLEVKVECTNESAVHKSKFERYALKNVDEDSKFAIGEVDQSGDVPTCTVTIGSVPYVAAFDGTTGKAHDPADTTKTVDLVYNKETGKWALKNEDDATVVFQVACTTEEPEVPGDITDADLAKLKVVIHCTTNGSHTDRTYDLIAGNYSLDYSDEGFTCYIAVPAAPYVNKYISDTGTNHELVDPQKSSKTITLRWNTETKEWAADSNSVTFDVKCKPDAPKAEDLWLSVVIHCKSDVHNDGLYDLTDDTFTVGEVEGNEADGYTCKVTVEAAQYVNKYVSEMKVNHDIVGEDTETVTLRYESALERWTVDSTVVTFDVECIPAPNISMLQVQVHCVTPNSSHMDESYDLPEDTTLEYVDANTRKITVQAAPYVERYGNGHELADGESESKTITATWDGVKWNFDATSVTFDVKCTTQEAPPAPTAEQVASLLKVKVSCANLSAAHQKDVPAFVYQPLLPSSFVVGEVTGSAESGYACRITVRAALYVQDFNTRSNATHTPTDGTEKAVTLYYEDGGWTVGTGSGLVEFTVICENVPAQKYTVTYTDGVDGVEIFKDQVYADLTAGTATPKFDGTPTRVGYFFAGWNPAVTATVTGNVTYTATWKVDSNNNGKPDDEEERYTVTYLDGANGKAFASQVYPGLLSGTATPKFDGTPVRSGYVFIGWSPVWSGTVTGNVTYTATWSTITGGLDKVPKTGDNGLTLALSALLLFSFCGAAACVVSTKKRG